MTEDRSLRIKILIWWYRIGIKWTEQRCRRKGGKYYEEHPNKWRMMKLLGWD